MIFFGTVAIFCQNLSIAKTQDFPKKGVFFLKKYSTLFQKKLKQNIRFKNSKILSQQVLNLLFQCYEF